MNYSGVYCLVCECGHKYIGRTFRSFNTRIKEHITMINPAKLVDINYLKQRSSFADHILTCTHTDEKKHYTCNILHFSSDSRLILMLESVEIICSMNANPRETLNHSVDFTNLPLIKALINGKFIH